MMVGSVLIVVNLLKPPTLETKEQARSLQVAVPAQNSLGQSGGNLNDLVTDCLADPSSEGERRGGLAGP